MKLITSIIKPFKLDEVREALAEIGVTGLTSLRSKDLVAKKAIQNSTVALNMSSIFYPK